MDTLKIIAGPCSAETEEQVLTTAHALANNGIKIFRAGIWKPRTKPGSFEGNGEKALPWMQRVKQETGMQTATEVATPSHVEAALRAGIDIFWIGARTSVNPFAVQEIADALRGTDIPVLVKNPINPDVELWTGAVERLQRAGIRQLGLIHRGFSSYDEKKYRYQPMWQIPIEMRRRMPDIPMYCDPSHMSGNRNFIRPLIEDALMLGIDGLMVECHCRPDEAWSDARQQITPDTFRDILSNLTTRRDTEETECINILRHQIDDIDNQLLEILSKRMEICREIGRYKKEQGMKVVHTTRYNQILESHESQSDIMGISPHCIKNIFEELHEESVRQQMEIVREGEAKQS